MSDKDRQKYGQKQHYAKIYFCRLVAIFVNKTISLFISDKKLKYLDGV